MRMRMRNSQVKKRQSCETVAQELEQVRSLWIVNMAELSSEEFRRNLFQTFRSRGVLEALKVMVTPLHLFKIKPSGSSCPEKILEQENVLQNKRLLSQILF